MSTTLLLASLCVLGEPQKAVAVWGFVRPPESVFQTPLKTLPAFAYETHLIVRQNGKSEVIRLRTSSPLRVGASGVTFVLTCNSVS